MHLIVLASCLSLALSQEIRFLGAFNVSMPGFTNFYEHEGGSGTDRYSLVLSTFDPTPFTRDTSWFFRYIGRYLDDLESLPFLPLETDLSWPREPSQNPLDVFGFETITQPDGFLVFGKNNGTVHVIDMRDMDNPVPFSIVPYGETRWFYHRVTWRDFDGDGLKDGFTCRVNFNLITGVKTTEMLWLKQPASDPLGKTWEEHIIMNDICGTFSTDATFVVDGRTYYAVFTVGYFTNILAVTWSNDPSNLWTDNSLIETRIIDTGGQFYDLVLTDLNLDGRLEILVTINAAVNGSFAAYEVPDDFRYGEYVKHVIADGFDSVSGSNNGGAPGQCRAFKANVNDPGKPWIFLGGDDEGTAYYFIPDSQEADNWSYTGIKFLDVAGPGIIMGKLAAADVDGDGYSELFVPIYSQDRILIYTFAPAKEK